MYAVFAVLPIFDAFIVVGFPTPDVRDVSAFGYHLFARHNLASAHGTDHSPDILGEFVLFVIL